MALPDLIEIHPLTRPVTAEVAVPGSKSITNRALILAALARGETTLHGALWSEDTQVMTDCLQELGYMVHVAADPAEPCNRMLTVYGQGDRVPRGGTESQPLDLFVGNAGTAARFLATLLCLGSGVYRLHGVDRMHQRPQAALFKALRQLGYRIDSPNDRLPALFHGGGARPGRATVSIAESSQFASALFLSARAGHWRIQVTGDNAEASPYVAMTQRLVEGFPLEGGVFGIEPDASGGSYFWAGDRLAPAGSTVRVKDWPDSGWQMDAAFPRFLTLPETVSRLTDLGDSILTAMVMAPVVSKAPVRFTDLGRLRVQECERVEAIREELTRCGGVVEERGDTLTVSPAGPGGLHGASIQTYEDHRMAMCFAILGLKVGGIKIINPGCVKKTFPNYFQKLAAPPPQGLGVRVTDAATGAALRGEALFAM